MVELVIELDPPVTVEDDAEELAEEFDVVVEDAGAEDAEVEDAEVEGAEDDDDAGGKFKIPSLLGYIKLGGGGRHTHGLTGGLASVGKGRLCRLYVGATHVQDGRLDARRVSTADTLEVSRIGLSALGERQPSFESGRFTFGSGRFNFEYILDRSQKACWRQCHDECSG